MEEITLERLLDFSDEDLAVNREGKISEAQDYRLRVRRMWTIILGGGIMLVLIIIATLFIFFGRHNASAILFIAGVGLTICSAAIMGVITRHYLRLNTDIDKGEIHVISGKLERVLKPINRRTITYILRVNGTDIVVSREAFKLFEHDKHYTLYRTPYTGILLAAEKTQ